MANNPDLVYKVVAKRGDKLVSAMARSPSKYNPEPVIEYKIGDWSVTKEEFAANGYHILVFSSLEYAKSWVFYIGSDARMTNGELKIFQAAGRGKVRMRDPKNLTLIDLFGADALKKKTPHGMVWPLGMVMYKEIMLITEISH